MNCPNCHEGELNEAGICLACGFRAPQRAAAEGGLHADSGASEAQANGSSTTPIQAPAEQTEELPEWRVELSKRLQEIRVKKESGDLQPSSPLLHETGAPMQPVESAADTREEAIEELRLTPPVPAAPRKQRRAPRAVSQDLHGSADPAAQSRMESATTPASQPRPEHQAHPGPSVADLPLLRAKSASEGTHVKKTQDMVDSLRAAPPAALEHPSLQAEIRAFRSPQTTPGDGHRDDRLILLSRTLAGLVDLIIVIFCSGSFVFAVDVFEGINVFDAVSAIHYSLLWLAVYLVYSLFFLATARQTIGMMLTDLRIAGASGQEPGAIQLVVRCLAFLIGLGAAGIGLLLGCFDRQSRCMHDRLSHTYVERVIL